MNVISKMLLPVTMALGLAAAVEQSAALPTVGTTTGGKQRSGLRTTAAACNPATATIDLDINNVRSRLMTGGDMWWDRGTESARYEVPKGSGKNSLFAGSVWVGGKDEQGILKVAGQTYRSKGNDYWPGPTQVDEVGVNLAPDKSVCSDWDKFWKIDRATLIEFQEYQRIHAGDETLPDDDKFQTIIQWPATGNLAARGVNGSQLNQLVDSSYLHYGRNYAPFVDVDHDGRYNPKKGDYPDILGDQYIWWVFNDMGNVKLQSESVSIGMEVQTSAFGFSSKDFLNDATFIFYKLINRGVLNLNDTYMSTWTDADLGDANDDYIGCDTSRSLGILYNGKSTDGTGKPTDYGSAVPMIGVDFFIGPKRRTYANQRDNYFTHATAGGRYYHEDTLGMTVFNYFNNANNSPIGDPGNGLEMYRVMTGFNRIGQHLQNDQASCPSSTAYGPGPQINYVWPGNPERATDWSECICGTLTGDRRFVHSSGPFRLEAGGITNDIIIGACWVPNVGGCPNTSFSRIRAADDMIQDLFDNHFRTIEGPEAPRLVVREMDRKLVFYLVNDSVSTNFQEKFGYDTARKYRVSTPRTRRLATTHGDSLYRFEGYRVFQLKNASVSVNNIFGADGQVDQSVAQEVFEADIKNGVQGNIVNYVADPETQPGAGLFKAQIKVLAKDSGIQHSFQLTNDAFAKGNDKQFVNYKTYYFVALAYAYNNYIPFAYSTSDTAQLVPYLESSHAAGGRNIAVVPAMPNPANGDMGTVLNADYGSGVIITREDGIGNGGNATAFDSATESRAVSDPGYQALKPVYRQGEGPVKVKIVDPRLVQAADWKLFILGASADSARGITASTGGWRLEGSNGEVVYSQRNLTTANEQILEKYGMSIDVTQTARPGDSSAVNNGLISSDIIYNDPNKVWLSGVADGEQTSPLNWIRSGGFVQPKPVTPASCNFADIGITGASTDINPDPKQVYENLIPGSTLNKGTWAPVMLGAVEPKGDCGFGVVAQSMLGSLTRLQGVDVVFTSDKKKWTKCMVFEMQDDPTLSEGHASKFYPRSHRSWTGENSNNQPVYSTMAGDTGFSYFPGYAINTETGERLNMVFGEDSYLKSDNGADMIWNPSSRYTDPQGGVIFGGKHYTYVLSTKYDEDESLKSSFENGLPNYRSFRWMTLPLTYNLLPISQNFIPTDARVRIRVTTPYGLYTPEGALPGGNNGNPLYTFSTKALAPLPLSDAANHWNSDKQGLLDQIFVTPNPYYGYTPYETGRLDTRVRVVGLPLKATINIYSTDGTLIRMLTKDNPNQSFVDWDTRNAKGLSIASGMYIIHIQADGIGEKVIRWFGAMRPVDLTTY